MFEPRSSWLNSCLIFVSFGAIFQVLLISCPFVLHCPPQANVFVSSAPPRLPPHPCPRVKSPSTSSCAPLRLTSKSRPCSRSTSSSTSSTPPYTWVSSFPFVFLGIYHWHDQLPSLSFVGFFVGAFISIPPSLRTCIMSKSPSATKRVSLKQRCSSPSSSSPLSRSHMSVLVRMDISLEHAPDCANHGLKPLQHR